MEKQQLESMLEKAITVNEKLIETAQRDVEKCLATELEQAPCKIEVADIDYDEARCTITFRIGGYTCDMIVTDWNPRLELNDSRFDFSDIRTISDNSKSERDYLCGAAWIMSDLFNRGVCCTIETAIEVITRANLTISNIEREL